MQFIFTPQEGDTSPSMKSPLPSQFQQILVTFSGATDHHWSVIRSDQYLRFGTHVIRGLIYENKKSSAHVQSTHGELRNGGAWTPRVISVPCTGRRGWWIKPWRFVGAVAQMSQMTGNTSSMATYLKQHHPRVSLAGVNTKAAQQQHITTATMQPLVAQSDRAKAITNAMGVFIGADMRPNSVKGRKYAFLCCTLSCFSLIMLKRRYYALCTLRWFYIF